MEREVWFTQIWSSRKRDDGTLEPYAPISGIGIGPKSSFVMDAAGQRRMLEQFGNLAPGEPFFSLEAKFQLVNT
jgi:hypothetical protein